MGHNDLHVFLRYRTQGVPNYFYLLLADMAVFRSVSASGIDTNNSKLPVCIRGIHVRSNVSLEARHRSRKPLDRIEDRNVVISRYDDLRTGKRHQKVSGGMIFSSAAMLGQIPANDHDVWVGGVDLPNERADQLLIDLPEMNIG